MNSNYQQMEYLALIDLLAEETKLYTRAFLAGDNERIRSKKKLVASLIVEIKARKQRGMPKLKGE